MGCIHACDGNRAGSIPNPAVCYRCLIAIQKMFCFFTAGVMRIHDEMVAERKTLLESGERETPDASALPGVRVVGQVTG